MWKELKLLFATSMVMIIDIGRIFLPESQYLRDKHDKYWEMTKSNAISMWHDIVKLFTAIWKDVQTSIMTYSYYKAELLYELVLDKFFKPGTLLSMVRKIVADNNLKHNIELEKEPLPSACLKNDIEDGKDYIEFQSILSAFNFGFSNIKDAGCEIIAIYNLWESLGRRKNLSGLIYWFEIRNGFFGAFGVFPHHTTEYLKAHSVAFDLITAESKLPQPSFPIGKNYIIFCWNDKDTITDGAHTFLVKEKDGKLVQMNGYRTYLPSSKNWDGLQNSFEDIIECVVKDANGQIVATVPRKFVSLFIIN